MTITAHCLVKNEARFVWYAATSVLAWVEALLVWDTGSTDETWHIVKEIQRYGGSKVKTCEYGEVTSDTFAAARQEMLDQTTTDWFIIVDGDEIWWDESIAKVVEVIKSNKSSKIESIVVPTINLVGDMFHYQEEAAGQYHLASRRGHFNLRAINRNIPGLHSYGQHGQWGWVDENNTMIQNRDPNKIVFLDAPYLHATHLLRAGEFQKQKDVPKRERKLKYELGILFPRDFYYPEVFFRPRPSIVPSLWERMSVPFILRALVETPFRKLRRRLLPARTGY